MVVIPPKPPTETEAAAAVAVAALVVLVATVAAVLTAAVAAVVAVSGWKISPPISGKVVVVATLTDILLPYLAFLAFV